MLIITFTFFTASFAQELKLIEGTVIHAETKTPLEYVSVFIKDKGTGVITNADGKFRLRLRNDVAHDSLTVSMMGFKTWQRPLHELESKVTISLVPQALLLEEVVVEDDLSAVQILAKFVENYKHNYPSSAFSYKAFYCELKKVDTTYMSLIEADVTVISDRYQVSRQEDVMINEIRKTIGYTHPYNSFWNKENLLWHSLRLNSVKNDYRDFTEYKNPQRLDNTSIDDVAVYVIYFDEGPYWPTTFYIRCDNFAIIRVQEQYDYQPTNLRTWKVQGNPLVSVTALERELVVEYREKEGRYYPHLIKMSNTLDYRDRMTEKSLLKFAIDHLLVVREISLGKLNVSQKQVIDRNVSMEDLAMPYHAEFWQHYEVLQDSQLDEKIRKDLEKMMKLEEQFQKN
jgi:hypothetical protein